MLGWHPDKYLLDPSVERSVIRVRRHWAVLFRSAADRRHRHRGVLLSRPVAIGDPSRGVVPSWTAVSVFAGLRSQGGGYSSRVAVVAESRLHNPDRVAISGAPPPHVERVSEHDRHLVATYFSIVP
jgi:hypothetical protein